MSTVVVAALVRTGVYAAALAAFYLAVELADGLGGDALGAGLLAFAVIALASFGWAFVDGRRRDLSQAIVTWAIVAAVFSVGWLVARAVIEADASMSAIELITHDAFTIPFTASLVLGPAVVGAAIGQALRPARIGA